MYRGRTEARGGGGSLVLRAWRGGRVANENRREGRRGIDSSPTNGKSTALQLPPPPPPPPAPSRKGALSIMQHGRGKKRGRRGGAENGRTVGGQEGEGTGGALLQGPERRKGEEEEDIQPY